MLIEWLVIDTANRARMQKLKTTNYHVENKYSTFLCCRSLHKNKTHSRDTIIKNARPAPIFDPISITNCSTCYIPVYKIYWLRGNI